MKIKNLITAVILFSSGFGILNAEIIKLDTDKTSMVFKADKGKKLKHLYYGDKIQDSDLKNLTSAVGSGATVYPDYGMITVPETAVAMIHSDGNMTLDLRVEAVEKKIVDGKDVTSIILKDSYYPVSVKINYKSFPEQDMFET